MNGCRHGYCMLPWCCKLIVFALHSTRYKGRDQPFEIDKAGLVLGGLMFLFHGGVGGVTALGKP